MPEVLLNLENQTAIITGAAQGIGRAIAERLARAGARVAISDLNLEAARATASEIGTSATAIQVDVSKTAEVDRMVHSLLEQWGQIDILVNNAGIVGRDVPVKDLTETDWDQVLDINLKGTFLCSKAVIGHMIDRKQGAIVSIASISGKEGNASMAPYSVSKAGIICFTKALAKEVIHDGVRINCVAPALIQTPLLDKVTPEQIDVLTSKIPLGRLGRPEEVATLVHFLASEDASFTTGQCYDISGGRATY
jgi:3-oxoacyl-[acyl-carrier protein] reductase